MIRGMRAAVGALAMASLVLISGCINDKNANSGGSAPTPAPSAGGGATAPPAGGKKFVVGFAQANSKDPWRQVQNASLKEAVKQFPEIDLKEQDAANDNQTQIGQVETFLTQKVDLLLISPNESAPLTDAVGKVYDAKIPVVLMDRAIESDKYTTFLGGDNKDIGKQAGEYIVQKSGGKGSIVEIYGKSAATPTRDRHDGFAGAIAGSPGLKVVDHQDCGYERNAARTYMENVLQKHTPFTIIYAHNDEMALGAIAALKAAGKDPKQYIIVGIDGVQEEAINAIKAGEMSATFKYPWLGPEAIQTAHDILAGKQVPKKQTLPTERVTVENADAYLAKLPKF
jgi:ribose transport system substrate-binding protein